MSNPEAHTWRLVAEAWEARARTAFHEFDNLTNVLMHTVTQLAEELCEAGGHAEAIRIIDDMRSRIREHAPQ